MPFITLCSQKSRSLTPINDAAVGARRAVPFVWREEQLCRLYMPVGRGDAVVTPLPPKKPA